MLPTGLLFPSSIISTSKPLPSFSAVKNSFLPIDSELLDAVEQKSSACSDPFNSRESNEFHHPSSHFFGSSFDQQAANFRTFDRMANDGQQLHLHLDKVEPPSSHLIANPADWQRLMAPLFGNQCSYSNVCQTSAARLSHQTDRTLLDARPPTQASQASGRSPKPAHQNRLAESAHSSLRSVHGARTIGKRFDNYRSANGFLKAKVKSEPLSGAHLDDCQAPSSKGKPDSNNAPFDESTKETATNQQVTERLRDATNESSRSPFRSPSHLGKLIDRRRSELANRSQSQFKPLRNVSAMVHNGRKKAKKSKQQSPDEEDRKRRRANQQERDRMRKLNDALDVLRQEMQKRCVFDLSSSSMNSTVTLCLPEHRASKGFGSVSLLVALKPEKSDWSSDSNLSELDQCVHLPDDRHEVPNKMPNSQTSVSKTKKLSKIMTLRLASKYITLLNNYLGR